VCRALFALAPPKQPNPRMSAIWDFFASWLSYFGALDAASRNACRGNRRARAALPLARIPAPLPLLPARARPRPRRRPVHTGRDDPVPGPRPGGQDNAAAHAEARPHWLARADAAPRACAGQRAPALGARRARARARPLPLAASVFDIPALAGRERADGGLRALQGV
jgi:hypothetical protein